MIRKWKAMYYGIMIAVVIFAVSPILYILSVYGKTVSENEQIEQIFDEMNLIVSQYNKGIISLLERDSKIAVLESSLRSYGVESLSATEAVNKGIVSDNSNNSTKAIVPGTTKKHQVLQ